MSFVSALACVRCGGEYREDMRSDGSVGQRTCPQCGPADGILDVRFDLDRAKRSLTREALGSRALSHWRYRELLPLDDAHCPPTLADVRTLHGSERGDGQCFDAAIASVGWTPIIEAPRLATALGVRRVRLKDEGRNASGSFKDRASSVGVARAMQEGCRAIACASTGNAASSLACCAASAGLECNIFVSRIVPDGKLAQLLAFGARVFKVLGSYAEAYELCTQACRRFGWYNRNAAINPYLVEGKKTGGLEVAEQCANDPPDWVACSVGDGCSIAGVHKGIVQMKGIGLIDWGARMLGVQTAGVAPIATAFADVQNLDSAVRGSRAEHSETRPGDGATGRGNQADAAVGPRGRLPERLPASTGDTYADSINVPVPRNWRKAMNSVMDSGGAFVTVSDPQIMDAVRLTGRLTGVFAEPAAAATVAGIAEARRRGVIDANASVLTLITGNGLKDTMGARRAVGDPHKIQPSLDAVARIVENS